MDKYYFIEVQRFLSVNNMGLDLGRYVEDKYNHAVIHADCMYDIKADITAKMEELQNKYAVRLISGTVYTRIGYVAIMKISR